MAMGGHDNEIDLVFLGIGGKLLGRLPEDDPRTDFNAVGMNPSHDPFKVFPRPIPTILLFA